MPRINGQDVSTNDCMDHDWDDIDARIDAEMAARTLTQEPRAWHGSNTGMTSNIPPTAKVLHDK